MDAIDETVQSSWFYEEMAVSEGFVRIAGVDEAGRGPLAGPVVAAAVILPGDFPVAGVTDSKQLTSRKRGELYEDIYRWALAIGIGIVDPVEIDRINILQAAMTAMAIAVENLQPVPDLILVDGNMPIPPRRFSHQPSGLQQKSIVGGDSKSISIAAASIVAKVARDAIMADMARQYPGYGWESNAGYPTKRHINAIAELGVTPFHRRSFKPIRNILCKEH